MPATTKKQIKLTFQYEYGDRRNYTITKKNPENDYDASDLKQRINTVNANMPQYFSYSFTSDYQDPLEKITDAQFITTEEEVIYGHQ